jgi:hypothetical protein
MKSMISNPNLLDEGRKTGGLRTDLRTGAGMEDRPKRVECGKCGWRFPTAKSYDSHRKFCHGPKLDKNGLRPGIDYC